MQIAEPEMKVMSGAVRLESLFESKGVQAAFANPLRAAN